MDIGDNPALEVKGVDATAGLILDNRLGALGQIGLMAQIIKDGVVIEVGRLHDGHIRPKGYLSAGLAGSADFFDIALGLTLLIGLLINVAIAVNSGHQAGRQSIDYTDPDPVQTAGDLVAAGLEFTSGVQDGQDCFQGTLAGLGVLVDWDAPAIVGYPHSPISQQSNDNLGGKASNGLRRCRCQPLP